MVDRVEVTPLSPSSSVDEYGFSNIGASPLTTPSNAALSQAEDNDEVNRLREELKSSMARVKSLLGSTDSLTSMASNTSTQTEEAKVTESDEADPAPAGGGGLRARRAALMKLSNSVRDQRTKDLRDLFNHQKAQHLKRFEMKMDVRCMGIVGDDQVWTASRDGSIHIKDIMLGSNVGILRAHRPNTRVTHKIYVNAIYSDDMHGKVWVGSSDGIIRIYHMGSRKMLAELTDHSGGIKYITGTEDAVWSCSEDFTIFQRSVHDGTTVKHLVGHASWVHCMVVDPLHGHLWSGSVDGIRIWNPDMSSSSGLLSGDLDSKRKKSRRGSKASIDDLASISSIQTDGFVDSTNLALLRGHEGAVMTLAVQGDNIWSGGADKCICIWDVHEKTLLQKFQAHNNWVHCMIVVDEEVMTASGSEIVAWNQDGERVNNIELPGKGKVADMGYAAGRLWIGLRSPGAMMVYRIHSALAGTRVSRFGSNNDIRARRTKSMYGGSLPLALEDRSLKQVDKKSSAPKKQPRMQRRSMIAAPGLDLPGSASKIRPSLQHQASMPVGRHRSKLVAPRSYASSPKAPQKKVTKGTKVPGPRAASKLPATKRAPVHSRTPSNLRSSSTHDNIQPRRNTVSPMSTPPRPQRKQKSSISSLSVESDSEDDTASEVSSGSDMGALAKLSKGDLIVKLNAQKKRLETLENDLDKEQLEKMFLAAKVDQQAIEMEALESTIEELKAHEQQTSYKPSSDSLDLETERARCKKLRESLKESQAAVKKLTEENLALKAGSGDANAVVDSTAKLNALIADQDAKLRALKQQLSEQMSVTTTLEKRNHTLNTELTGIKQSFDSFKQKSLSRQRELEVELQRTTETLMKVESLQFSQRKEPEATPEQIAERDDPMGEEDVSHPE